MLNYQTYGKTNASAVVFLHGFMGNLVDFQLFTDIISQRFFCISFDLPGHGKSINLEESAYTIEQTCTEIYSSLQKMNIANCTIVGYSFGGRIALSFVDRYRDFVSSLVLISTSPGIQLQTERNVRIVSDINKIKTLENNGLIEFLNRWYEAPIFSGIPEKLKEQLIADKGKNIVSELAKSLKNAGTGVMQPLWGILSELHFSILQIVGERDKKFCDINIKMQELLPKSTLEIIPNCSHYVHLEQTEIVLSKIYNFLIINGNRL